MFIGTEQTLDIMTKSCFQNESFELNGKTNNKDLIEMVICITQNQTVKQLFPQFIICL